MPNPARGYNGKIQIVGFFPMFFLFRVQRLYKLVRMVYRMLSHRMIAHFPRAQQSVHRLRREVFPQCHPWAEFRI
jgi:hypothetical protein